MDDEMRGRILEAETLARVGSGSDAMSIADQLTIQAPEELEVWMLRGYLHERSGNYVHAKSDFSQAIQCNNLEPHLFFCRGRFFYHLGELDEAILDFGKGLELCDFHQNDYYRSELLFWRAATFSKLGQRRAALNDLRTLLDDYRSWIDEPVTKMDLINACQ